MYLEVVTGILPDKPEVVDECKFGCSAYERERVHLLRYANRLV
jgi:hypothetical protein